MLLIATGSIQFLIKLNSIGPWKWLSVWDGFNIEVFFYFSEQSKLSRTWHNSQFQVNILQTNLILLSFSSINLHPRIEHVCTKKFIFNKDSKPNIKALYPAWRSAWRCAVLTGVSRIVCKRWNLYFFTQQHRSHNFMVEKGFYFFSVLKGRNYGCFVYRG